MWRNWYTRWSQKPMALPCEFESHHLHNKHRIKHELYAVFSYDIGAYKRKKRKYQVGSGCIVTFTHDIPFNYIIFTFS